jgi:hypothetical protein
MESRRDAFANFSSLAVLLLFDLVLTQVVALKVPYSDPLPEYNFPALEFAQTHHISSIFLPIGYSALLGLGQWIFHGQVGRAVVGVSLYLVWVTFVWLLLQQLGATAKQALIGAAVFSVYPDIVLSMYKVMDTTLTSVLLLSFLTCIVYLVRTRDSYRADILLALALGIGITVRPNLVLLFPLTWFVLWRYKLPKKFLRAVGQFAIAVALYAAVTMAVHGSVFLPHNGPYNLFAGANEYTEQGLSAMSAENSIIPALKDRGIVAEQHWDRPDSVPGVNDIRDLQYERLYTHEAIAYMEAHPLTIIELPVLKVVVLLRPDTKAHNVKSAAGIAKVVLACVFPAWVIAFCLLPRPGQGVARVIMPLTIATYIVPFLLTVSAPRFRVPIDILCLVEIVAILFSQYGWGESPETLKRVLRHDGDVARYKTQTAP